MSIFIIQSEFEPKHNQVVPNENKTKPMIRNFHILLCISLFFASSFALPTFAQSQETVKPTTNSNSNLNYNNSNAPVPAQEMIEEKEAESDKSAIQFPSPSLKKDATSSQKIESNEAQFESFETQSNYMRSQRTPNATQQSKMNEAVNVLEQYAPESFEYNLYKYQAGNHNVDLISFLRKAESLNKYSTDVKIQFAAYYLITGSGSTRYLELLIESKTVHRESIIYSKDVLRSVSKNGTLVTHGMEDTYATNYAQLNDNFRKDVTIVSLELLQSEAYKNALQAKGYKIPNTKLIDVSFLVEFCKLNESKGISIAMTTPKEYLQPLKTQLYAQGLVFEYHSASKEYNNYYMNDVLWNKELDKSIIQNFSSDLSNKLSANYLPMLFVLRKNYQASGELQQLKSIDAMIDKIGKGCNKYEQVQKLKGSY